MKTIILFGHKARSGKDTSCDYLVEKYGFKKYSFAGKLKEIACELYGFNNEHLNGKLKEVPTEYSIDGNNLSPRNILQIIGQDQRKIFADVWVKYVLDKIKESSLQRFCISDLRFRNEVEYIKNNIADDIKICCVKLVRDLEQNISGRDDISEHDLDSFVDWNVVINNNGSLQDLYKNLDELVLR